MLPRLERVHRDDEDEHLGVQAQPQVHAERLQGQVRVHAGLHQTQGQPRLLGVGLWNLRIRAVQSKAVR